jgi:hypothetical protein
MTPPSQTAMSSIAALALALGACAANPPPAGSPATPKATVPPELQPQGESSLIARLHAEGTQIYTCQQSSDPAAAGYAWTLKAPSAKLYDDAGQLAATHFAGPTWKSTVDGSEVVGAKVTAVPAPVPGAIPWLLLKAVAKTGQGQFTPVVAIQRVETVGGIAPDAGCSAATVGAVKETPYKAEYYFFGQGKSASGKEGGKAGPTTGGW